MSTIEQSVEVDVPVRVAYDRWTRFESFPEFMGNVDEVRQIDDTHLHWKATILGKTEEWDAEITEQHADHRIAWRSTQGATNAGVVTFHQIDEDTTRIMLQLDVEPEGLVEKAGDALGIVNASTKGDCSASRSSSRPAAVRTAGGERSRTTPTARRRTHPPAEAEAAASAAVCRARFQLPEQPSTLPSPGRSGSAALRRS